MTYPFGKDFTAWYYPLVDGETPSGLLTSAASLVNIFVFDDGGIPSRDVAASGTGAVQTISSWTWEPARKGFYFTVSAIDDPDPTSATSIRTYWLAINTRLQTSEQVQTVLRSIDLERVKGPGQAVYVTDDDLQAYYPEVTAYSNSAQRTAFVSQALLHVKAELKSQGWRWALIHKADELTAAVTLKALMMLCLSKVQSSGDKFDMKYSEFKEMYNIQMSSVLFEYDGDEDGRPDAEVSPEDSLILLRR